MRTIACIALALATFVGGYAVGADRPSAAPAHARAHRLSFANASRYADWCGGYVQVVPIRRDGTGPEDISVQGCDR